MSTVDAQRFVRRKDREAMREAAGSCWAAQWTAQHEEWLREDGGSPLGVGMPSGSPLREDGESHSDAWRRILRGDDCAYCGRPGGTVEHVIPRSLRRPGLERWPNLVGACEPCNASKGAKGVLLWMLERRTQVRRRRVAA